MGLTLTSTFWLLLRSFIEAATPYPHIIAISYDTYWKSAEFDESLSLGQGLLVLARHVIGVKRCIRGSIVDSSPP